MKPFFITTPIYYVNDRPHIGTAYSTIAVDVFSRFQRLQGRDVRSLTGLDEHGLKIERKARELQKAPQAFVDGMAEPFKAAWDLLHCRFDDFIRTTEPRHKTRVQRMWQLVEESGDIYLGHYEDWYCVDCETFYTEKDLIEDQHCPVHKRRVEKLKEESYFFKLSAYTEKLTAFYESHPGFVKPEGRFNEVKSFVKEGLRDLSVSRASFRWGIPVPSHPAHVMYVWFDALANYTSELNLPLFDREKRHTLNRYWPSADRSAEAIHVVGKDILRFHAVYWPAFLMSAGLEPPSQIYAHGWLTVDGEKMSKSAGNFIAPEPLAEKFGADVLRYYLMREVAFGQDGDFSHTALQARYNGDLGNGIGNLLNRMVSSIVKKDLGGLVPDPVHRYGGFDHETDTTLVGVAKRSTQETASLFQQGLPHKALEAIWELVAAANKYVDSNAPWTLSKKGEHARLKQVSYMTLEALRWLSVMLWPVMPDRSDTLRKQLGLVALFPNPDTPCWPHVWGGLQPGTITQPGAPLFPRFEEEKKESARPVTVVVEDKTEATSSEPKHIRIDDFAKIELKLGLITEASRVEKSEKLLKLIIDIGEPVPRQILSGIGKTYLPEELVGKQVVVIANLPPRKMMGHESQGMVLAASDEHGLSVLLTDKALKPGSRIT